MSQTLEMASKVRCWKQRALGACRIKIGLRKEYTLACTRSEQDGNLPNCRLLLSRSRLALWLRQAQGNECGRHVLQRLPHWHYGQP